MADDAEVMGDEEVGQPELVLHVLEQVDDLRLHGDVERGDRLVGDDQLGPQRKCAGDADALALAAGELVREPVVVLGLQADAVEQVLHAALQLRAAGQPVQLERVADDLAHPLARIERGERVLEDHLHLPAHRAQVATRPADQFLAGEPHRPGRRGRQLQDRPAQRRLAASGFAYQARVFRPL